MEQISLEKSKNEILEELNKLNARILNMINFRIIHTLMKADVSNLKNTSEDLKKYKSHRWQKALKTSKGNKKVAYRLLASEDFY